MNRVDVFRQKRQFRRKIKIVVITFLLFILAGIVIADYSVNSLMKDENRIEMVTMDNKKDYYVFDLLGKKIYIKLTHIKNDCEKVKDMIRSIIG
ncbi:MAG TPA: hypothetical protein VHT34_12490 [Clostridia bacterium]|nr:hypothetical protein [Clostridia bacterium]